MSLMTDGGRDGGREAKRSILVVGQQFLNTNQVIVLEILLCILIFYGHIDNQVKKLILRPPQECFTIF